MRLHNIKDVREFLEAVNRCKGAVWLESTEGDQINLKSELSQYIAISALLSQAGDKLELFCGLSADQENFFKLFASNDSIER